MKNKGFTLIELLAIIVILAIIAVITTPIILNIIEKAHIGALTNSAYGYKDAIGKLYVSNSITEKNFQLIDNIYEIDSDGNLNYTDINNEENNIRYEINVDGDRPTGGTVQIENNTIKEACIQFNEYSVIMENGKVLTTKKETCKSKDITDGLRDRVFELYGDDIKTAQNYFLVYRNNFQSVDLILYDENYDFKTKIYSTQNAEVPDFSLSMSNNSKTYKMIQGITKTNNGLKSTYTDSERFFTGGIQPHIENQQEYIELGKYPNNISNYQVYKNLFGKIIDKPTNIKLEDILTLPNNYNGTPCRDYLVLTYGENAQFYCITGDANFIYNPSEKNLIFQYNNGHMYRFKYDENWNIVYDTDVNWTSLNNTTYKNYDIIDILKLSTFDIKDQSGNVYYEKNAKLEKLTTNYE